jgi:hypothetical protein
MSFIKFVNGITSSADDLNNNFYHVAEGDLMPLIKDTMVNPFNTDTATFLYSLTCTGIKKIFGDIFLLVNSTSVYKSLNIGVFWSLTSNLGTGTCYETNNFVYLTNGTCLCAMNLNKIYKSNDYGSTWSNTSSLYGSNYNCAVIYLGNGICLANNNYAGAHIIKSLDYGSTWSSSSILLGNDIGDIIYLGSNTCILGNDVGCFYKSLDAGSTWILKQTIGAKWIKSLSYLGGGICLAGVYSYPTTSVNSIAKIYRSNDYGETWSLNKTFSTASSWPQKFYNMEDGLIFSAIRNVGNYRSNDYGETWSFSQTNTTYCGDVYDEETIIFANTSTIYQMKTAIKCDIGSDAYRWNNCYVNTIPSFFNILKPEKIHIIENSLNGNLLTIPDACGYEIDYYLKYNIISSLPVNATGLYIYVHTQASISSYIMNFTWGGNIPEIIFAGKIIIGLYTSYYIPNLSDVWADGHIIKKEIGGTITTSYNKNPLSLFGGSISNTSTFSYIHFGIGSDYYSLSSSLIITTERGNY